MPAPGYAQRVVCRFHAILSPKHPLTYPQYPTPQPGYYPNAGAIPSPPSARFAQAFYSGGYAPPGAHSPSRNHHPHSNSDPRVRRSSHSHSAQYAHGRGHVQPAPVLMHHHSQSRPQGLSTSSGPRVADYHFNHGMAYSSHSHSDPRYTHARPILKNRGGVPPMSVVPHQHVMARRGSAPPPPAPPSRRVQFNSNAYVRRF